ncbi:photosynthetic complex putative assembly protein PuhB [Sphingomonas sp. S1-29]|uniref:photosynthetic complex putative assembly protein PuhB n=1 Tax=Sphingomonas sp. S1-29 TaxID=2991074 RepID=UPI00223FC2B3|nr:photosynthetic complex putative assembly protein PuhB [Sphingomonas sp. S1-29]UZK69551.1 photosynthetic complex putative assembly protein PuhB [Sphingomonas sp. S1-29]
MITEYEIEPVPGLPAPLPRGERIVWQGKPEWRTLARTAFHTRMVAGYFTLLTIVAAIGSGGNVFGIAMTALSGVACVALLSLIAWGTARGAVYTLTDKRLVLRIGIALPKCINLPLTLVGSVDLVTRADGTGDVALNVTGAQNLGYVALWPHARPWKLSKPQPMLRSIPEAEQVGALIARLCLAASPQRQASPAIPQPSVHSYGEAVAA